MNFGAINKDTSQYILPINASKCHKYECPDCNKDLILCKGKIQKPHFRHRVDKINPCKFFTSPNETQIHKDAKLRLKELFETKNITINRYCNNCKKTKEYNIPKLCDKSKICIEYRFLHNGSNKSADLVYLTDGKIVNIYEICHSHKTKDINRPEPWFEFEARDIVASSYKEQSNLEFKCIRDKFCDNCIYMENLKINDLEKWVRIKLGQDFDNPKYISSEDKIIDEDTYKILKNKDIDEYYRIYHKRIDFDAQEDFDNNRDICNIFLDDLNSNKILIYSGKGMIHSYIISGSDYNKYNYWDINKNKECGSGRLALPYLNDKGYCGDGTVDILVDLITNALKFIPNNNCNYT